MQYIRNDNYFIVHGWMITELGLSGTERDLFAIIYGFSQDEESRFSGNLKYLAEWLGCSNQTVLNNLKSLLNKNLIFKEDIYINNTKTCHYRVNFSEFDQVSKNLTGVSKNLTGGVKKFDRGCQKICTNKEYNKEYNKAFTKVNADENQEKTKIPLLSIESKKTKKAKDIITMKAMISAFTQNELIQNKLLDYFAVRLKTGLTPTQWQVILEDLRKFAGENADIAVDKINNAISGGYRSIIAAWEKGNKNKKPIFETADKMPEKKDAIATMSVEEQKNFFANELAKDEKGNLLAF